MSANAIEIARWPLHNFLLEGVIKLRHSNAYNSKPEVEIGKFSTTFFTAHRALKRAVYSVCKLAPQVGETAKVPRPQNV